MISRKYRCSCGAQFNGLNSKSLAKLPTEVQESSSFRVYDNTLMDKELVTLLKRQIVSGQSIRDFRRMMQETKYSLLDLSPKSRAEIYNEKRDAYNRFAIREWEAATSRMQTDGTIRKIPDFPLMESDLCGFKAPCEQTLGNIFKSESDRANLDIASRLMMVTGRILKLDATFKVAKIAKERGKKVFSTLLTAMTGLGIIAGWWFTKTQALKEGKPGLQRVRLPVQR